MERKLLVKKVEIDTDGKQHSVGSLILNPTGEQGNNYVAYPMLVDWGYYVAKGQKATFSHIEVRNFKSPQNVVAAPLQQLSASQLSANQLSANQLSVCRTPDKKEMWVFSGEYSPLLHLPQTVFHPKRFASFRPLLYQRFKVNFLPLHPSPGFHREMIHSIQIPIYKCKPTGNQ